MQFIKLFIPVLFLLCFVFTTAGFGQQHLSSKWHIKTGVSSLSVSNLHGADFENAYEFSTEIGYRMPTGFEIGIGFSVANINTSFSEKFPEQGLGNFGGLDGKEIHHSFRLLVGYHILLGGSQTHIIGLGSGIMLLGQQRIRYDLVPLVVAEAPDGELFFQTEIRQFSENQLFGEIGFPLNIEYLFRLSENLALGVRMETQYNFNDNFNRFSVGPRLAAFF